MKAFFQREKRITEVGSSGGHWAETRETHARSFAAHEYEWKVPLELKVPHLANVQSESNMAQPLALALVSLLSQISGRAYLQRLISHFTVHTD